MENCKVIADRVGFCGFGGVGKDAAYLAIKDTHIRHNFGDIVKRQVDEFVKSTYGFSAFTENSEQKAKIRPLLEAHGDANYDSVFDEYFANLPIRCCNTRLVKVREARKFKELGGRIYEVVKPYVDADTEWSRFHMAELRKSHLIDGIIINNGTIPELHAKILALS